MLGSATVRPAASTIDDGIVIVGVGIVVTVCVAICVAVCVVVFARLGPSIVSPPMPKAIPATPAAANAVHFRKSLRLTGLEVSDVLVHSPQPNMVGIV